MKRGYTSIIEDHLKKYRQMIFLAGPRQVGKTTCSKALEKEGSEFYYFNWEISEDRKLIISGAREFAAHLSSIALTQTKPLIVFDEIHRYRTWKSFLKGFFDLYENKCQIIVTGSAKLDIYVRGGDSLMGRYFPYHIHPLSVGELISQEMRQKEIVPPNMLPKPEMDRLLEFGGFPEPFIQSKAAFSRKWQLLRKQQLLQQDIRELSQIQDLAELEVLLDLLEGEAGNMLNISSIANHLNVAQSTIHRWIKVLEAFYYCFTIKPWSKNIRKSLRKTPKVFLWDWSTIEERGQRIENFIASHLHKSVHYWTDIGLGEFKLYYLRDLNKREVDFLVTKDKQPWFLVEAKSSNNKKISKHLYYFQKELNVPHAFQVVYDMPYVDADCFSCTTPVIVPASTFLSQLT